VARSFDAIFAASGEASNAAKRGGLAQEASGAMRLDAARRDSERATCSSHQPSPQPKSTTSGGGGEAGREAGVGDVPRDLDALARRLFASMRRLRGESLSDAPPPGAFIPAEYPPPVPNAAPAGAFPSLARSEYSISHPVRNPSSIDRSVIFFRSDGCASLLLRFLFFREPGSGSGSGSGSESEPTR
jgi:hypothetical protein